MKLFEFDSGETEWIAAETEKKAINFYSKLTGISKDEIKSDYEINEVPKEKWSEMTITNNDFDKEDEKDWKTKTFEEFMDDVDDTEYIASTVW